MCVVGGWCLLEGWVWSANWGLDELSGVGPGLLVDKQLAGLGHILAILVSDEHVKSELVVDSADDLLGHLSWGQDGVLTHDTGVLIQALGSPGSQTLNLADGSLRPLAGSHVVLLDALWGLDELDLV